jgi:carbon-monoxide dehydrogenase large subunit
MTRRYAGQGILRRDPQFLTGRARYVDNIALPGLLHAVVVRSPFVHTRIRAVDGAGALAVPGVVGVWSGAELREEWAAPLPMIWPITEDLHVPDHWPLALDEAKFVGDGVAVVVAESVAQAKDGAEAVAIDYEPLAAVTDPESALEEDAPLVHGAFGTNRCYRVTYSIGEVEKAFSEADLVVNRRLRVPRVIPSPMETRAALADPQPALGEFVLWTSSQVPHIVKRTLGTTVGIPTSGHRPRRGRRVRGEVERVRGRGVAAGSGQAARSSDKGVEERSEHSLAATHGRGQVQWIELAAVSDGTITGIRVWILASMGAYL